MDYYSILGVNKNASQDEIKKAYRRLAMQHHPDRGGDPEKLKKINEAYDTLKNPTKKQNYDNPQPRYDSSRAQNPFGHDVNDFFNDIFVRRRARNKDIRLVCELTLKEAIQGGSKIMHYKIPSGENRTVEIEFPPGIQKGNQINYRGLGDNSIPNAPEGNLQILFDVDSGDYDLDGVDIYYTLEISVFDLIIGKTIIINTPEGRHINLNIKPNTSPNTKLSVPQEGMPFLNQNRRGNFFIKFKTIMPELTDEQRKDIERIRKDIENISV